MQGAENQVTRQGCFQSYAGGFAVTHFTNHDHVRVAAKKGSHGPGEVQPNFVMHLNLAQSFLGYFHRVFSRPYFYVRLIDKSQR